jgi:hypothetical protein
MTNNPGGIRWQDGTPAYNEEVKKMTKEEQVEELVEYIVEAMDMSALENYAKQQLEEYYNSPEGVEDFNTNYAEMKEIMGDDE